MYIYARLFGITLFLILIFSMNFTIRKSKKENLKFIFLFYTISLAIMGYFYIPAFQADLTRIMSALDNYYVPMTSTEISLIIKSSGTPTAEILYYIFSKFNNPHLLPAFVAFIYYGILFYIVNKTKLLYNISNKIVANSILFFMISGQFLEVISNIRFPLAMSLICFCIFRELIENKKSVFHIILYIFAALLHQATMILIVIRIIYLISQKSKNKLMNILKPILLVVLFYCVFRFGSSYIFSAINRGVKYISGDGYSYIWEYIIALLCIVYIVFSLLLYKGLNKINPCTQLEEKNYYNFLRMMAIIVILFSIEYSIFHRYRTYVEFLFIPLYMILLQKMEKANYKSKKYTYLTFITKIALFLIVFSRGNMSSLKFFE